MVSSIGYMQRIDMNKLQLFAEQFKIQIHVQSLPGTFCTPDRAVALIENETDSNQLPDGCLEAIANASRWPITALLIKTPGSVWWCFAKLPVEPFPPLSTIPARQFM